MAGKESEASPFDQLCFTGESSCNLFRPHFLKPNMCTSCMKEISKHTKEAVPSEEFVLKASIIRAVLGLTALSIPSEAMGLTMMMS